MSHLYKRPGNRVPVYWEPDHTDLGEQAVESVVGTVPEYPADVTSEQAAQIREEYQRLAEETSGGST